MAAGIDAAADRGWALITGASAGLGSEFARQLAATGRNILLIARRREPMQALADELTKNYDLEVRLFLADLSRPSAPSDIYNFVSDNGLAVDYLVNNAGASGPDLLQVRDWAAHQAYLDLMMTSIAGLCHYFIPAMQQRGYGRVINVASVAGRIVTPGDYSYGPTKAYVVALSRGLAASIPQKNVKVLALCPGYVHTEFHNSEKLQKMKAATPGILFYNADTVVRESLRAVEKGKDILISGRLYRFAVPVLRSFIGRTVLKLFSNYRD